MVKWGSYYMFGIREIIITTLRNRGSIYVDHGFCLNYDLVAKELNNNLVRKLSITRSKDAFGANNIINILEKMIRQKEAQLGIYNDPTARQDNTSSTEKTP